VRFIPIVIFLILFSWLPAEEFKTRPGLLVRVWQSQDGLPGNVVRSMVQSPDGHLWVATAEGVARFDGYDFEIFEPEGRPRRLAFYRLFASSGHIWAATYQGGLFRSTPHGLRQILNNLKSPTPPVVTQLIEEPSGTYFKRGSEFCKIDANERIQRVHPTEELLDSFEKDRIKQANGGRSFHSSESLVLHDRLGREWTAASAGGLSLKVEDRKAIAVELPQIGKAYGMYELLEDKEGNIWVASHVNGLIRVRQSRVDVLDINHGQNERAVSALLEDRNGAWWIANRRGALNLWIPDHTLPSQVFRLSRERSPAALFEDDRDRLWVASRDGSVFRFDDGTFKPQFTSTQVPSKVRSITQDSEGTLWFAGSQGLSSFSRNEVVRAYRKSDGVGDLDLTVVQPFPGGKIIAGCTSGTVLLGDSHGFRVLATPDVMKHQWISGILTFSEKETWVSTLGSGLYLWNGEEWFCIDGKDGLPDSRLTCVLSDGNGYLWMGSLGGVIRAKRSELLGRVVDPAESVKWLRLDHTDGLPSRECVGGFQPAGWRSREGQLWFPTAGGVARINPALVEMNKVAPPVYMKKVVANGVLLPKANETVTTEPGRARLEFHFVGISLSSPGKVTYRARLAGLDDSWRELGNQRVAAYEAVPPGEYVFEVMAANGDGLQSRNPARIPIVIEPHFWQTSWFYVSVGGVILFIAAGVGWVAARIRMRGRIQMLKIRNARESERSRIARDLHDDLGASLTEISILAALAAEDAEKTKLQSPLDQLSVKAKHVVGSLDEIVWAVNPREDTMRSLVDYLAAFAREFLDTAKIPLRLDVARDIPDYPMATTQRHAVFLAAREAINNIVKHSGATEVTLRFSFKDQELEICLEDNGRGFDQSYIQTGNGLGNLKQRMQDAGGDCRIETHRNQGTMIFLTLPMLSINQPTF
jgi:signal transduction histidine kinase/ligand-binding sensor domain-containing protein